MQTLKRLTLSAIVGFGIGSTQTHAENTDATATTPQKTTSASPSAASEAPAMSQGTQDLLMEALRQKQAELKAVSSGSQSVDSSKLSRAARKALAKKEQEQKEAKIEADKKIKSGLLAAEKIRVKEEQIKKTAQASPIVATPIKTISAAPVSEPQGDELLAALRTKQAELAAKEAGVKPAIAAPANTASIQTPEANSDELLAALRQKQAELAAQGAAPKIAAPVVVTPAKVSNPLTGREIVFSQVPIQAVTTPTVSDEKQTAELLAALRAKQSELAAQANTVKVAAPVVAAPVVAVPVVKTAAVVVPAVAVKAAPTLTPDQADEVMAALRQKQFELATKESAAESKPEKTDKPTVSVTKAPKETSVPVVQAIQKPSPEVVPVKVKTVTATPTPAPVTTEPAKPLSKEQRLAEILRQYKLDLLTPREYHTQRAKIVAEP